MCAMVILVTLPLLYQLCAQLWINVYTQAEMEIQSTLEALRINDREYLNCTLPFATE